MPYIVPAPTPGTPRWGDYVGAGIQAGTDLLLKALMEGQLAQVPKQGSYTAPSGTTTALSPAEVSAQNPTVSLSQLLQRSGATQQPGVQFHPAGFPFQLQPGIKMLERKKLEGEIAAQPGETKYKAAQTSNLEAQAKAFAAWQKTLEGQPEMGEDENAASPGGFPLAPGQTFTELLLQPQAQTLMPGEVPTKSFGRSIERLAGMRETQRGLTEVYKSRTAAAAKAFGDSGNIAIEERKMMENSFPQDGESYERRVVKEASTNQFFDAKEQQLLTILHQPNKMVMTGGGKQGARYQIDPGIVTQKRQAATDLEKLINARTLYHQMYQEAAIKMPPIGAIPRGQSEDSPASSAIQATTSQSAAMVEAKRRGLIP